MSVIPGRYIDSDGNEVTAIAMAADGDCGEMRVIYRRDGARLFSLSESAWNAEGRFVSAEDAEYRRYLADKSEAALVGKLLSLFAPRTDIYSVHWKNAFGAKGYNHACENHSLVAGCYRGTDSCKNCRKGRLSSLDEEAVAAHLRGKTPIGIYPVENGECKFLVFELEKRSLLCVLRDICAEADIPCYVEVWGARHRLWIFFAERIALKYLRRLGSLLAARAMERSAEADFALYDSFIPCRDEVAAGSNGFQTELPFGRLGKGPHSCFVDEDFRPLEGGAAEAFRVRTLTKGYLAERLMLLQEEGPYELGPDSSCCGASFSKKVSVILDAGIVIGKSALSPKSEALLKRLACIRAEEKPFDEFEALEPCVKAYFTEDKTGLRLPRGLWSKVEALFKSSGADYSVTEAFPKRSKVRFDLCKTVTGEQLRAAAELGAYRTGVLSAPLGWGKTGVVAAIIAKKQRRTLILVADEYTRRRWLGKIAEYFQLDAEAMESSIHVRLMADSSVKDKYGLIILADCRRLPMNEELFWRLNALSPEYMYGITDAIGRRDGKSDYVHMLCGPVVVKQH